MPFALSFSVLSGFSRVSERKKEFYYFIFFLIFKSMAGSDVGGLFLSRLGNTKQG